MKRAKLFLPTLFSFTLIFLLVVGTVSCKDDKDEPDSTIEKPDDNNPSADEDPATQLKPGEFNLYDFNGYRFDGISDYLDVNYDTYKYYREVPVNYTVAIKGEYGNSFGNDIELDPKIS